MIVDERLVTYINSLDTGNTAILDTIEKEALETYVPIIRKEMQTFLRNQCCLFLRKVLYLPKYRKYAKIDERHR